MMRFRIKDGVGKEELERGLAAVSQIAKMESVSFSTFGRDLGDRAEGYTYAYCFGVADLDALDRYFSDPIHRRGDFAFIPLVAKLLGLTMTDDPDPTIGEKIFAMYNAKMAADPEWAQLLSTIPEARFNG
jgi:Stress responsive A/B Barrel Domain